MNKFKVLETHDGYVQVGKEDGTTLMLTRHEALLLAIQLVVSSTVLGKGEVAKALAEEP